MSAMGFHIKEEYQRIFEPSVLGSDSPSSFSSDYPQTSTLASPAPLMAPRALVSAPPALQRIS